MPNVLEKVKSQTGFSPIIIIAGASILLIGGIVFYNTFLNPSTPNSKQLMSSSSPSQTASSSASIKPAVSKKPAVSVIKTSPSPSPSPSSAPASNTPASSPTPPPSPKEALDIGYSLAPSESDVTMKVSTPTTGYSVSAILNKNGSVVTQQSDFEYNWSVDNASVISSKPSAGCTQGIQPPCPLDHNDLQGREVGQAKLNVYVRKISENIIVAKQQFNITVISR